MIIIIIIIHALRTHYGRAGDARSDNSEYAIRGRAGGSQRSKGAAAVVSRWKTFSPPFTFYVSWSTREMAAARIRPRKGHAEAPDCPAPLPSPRSHARAPDNRILLFHGVLAGRARTMGGMTYASAPFMLTASSRHACTYIRSRPPVRNHHIHTGDGRVRTRRYTAVRLHRTRVAPETLTKTL